MDGVHSVIVYICPHGLLIPSKFLKSLFCKSTWVLGLAPDYGISRDYRPVWCLLQVFYQIYDYELRNLYIHKIETRGRYRLMGRKRGRIAHKELEWYWHWPLGWNQLRLWKPNFLVMSWLHSCAGSPVPSCQHQLIMKPDSRSSLSKPLHPE